MNHSLPKQIPIDPCIREMKKTRITLPWQGTLNMRSIVIRTIDVWQNVMKNWNPTWPMKISTSLTPVVERIPIFMNCTPKIIHEFLQIRTSHKVTINKTLLSFTDKNTSNKNKGRWVDNSRIWTKSFLKTELVQKIERVK